METVRRSSITQRIASELVTIAVGVNALEAGAAGNYTRAKRWPVVTTNVFAVWQFSQKNSASIVLDSTDFIAGGFPERGATIVFVDIGAHPIFWWRQLVAAKQVHATGKIHRIRAPRDEGRPID